MATTSSIFFCFSNYTNNLANTYESIVGSLRQTMTCDSVERFTFEIKLNFWKL